MLFGLIGPLGPLELLVIAALMLLFFGNRLPKVMRSLGQGVVEFKKGIQGIEDDVNRPTNGARIEEEPIKSRAKEESKPVETETVQR